MLLFIRDLPQQREKNNEGVLKGHTFDILVVILPLYYHILKLKLNSKPVPQESRNTQSITG